MHTQSMHMIQPRFLVSTWYKVPGTGMQVLPTRYFSSITCSRSFSNMMVPDQPSSAKGHCGDAT